MTLPLGINDFAQRVVSWQAQHGRHHLPWQNTRDPYKIWLSEVMLQQTQVTTVLEYYARFLERFPDVISLATASQDEVMPYWAGLGYYTRARNLHRCAQIVHEQFDSAFPTTSTALAGLPGIGPSTANAIAAFAYGERAPIMDGNVKRVFCRYFGVYGLTHLRATEKKLWELAYAVLDAAPAEGFNMVAYTQGQMDLGSQICKRSRPDCAACPLQSGCYAYEHNVQAELPTPKPRKRLPQHHAQVLIWQQGDQVLLEQRPNHGIWGGLLSLPQFESEAAMHEWMQQRSMNKQHLQILPIVNHIFSHYKLQLQPWLYYAPQATPLLAEPLTSEHWLPLITINKAALPAPIYTLLSQVESAFL